MKTLYTINAFHPMDYQAIQQYLEHKAQKGYILKKIGYFFKFQKEEPQDLVYCVDFFPKITLFSSQNIEEAKDYRSFCEESGWKFVCGYDKMQIFCTKRSDHLIPIQTEDMIQYKIVKKSIMPTLIALILAFAYILYCIYDVFSYHPRFATLDDDFIRFAIPAVIFGVIIIAIELFRYFYLLLLNKHRIKNGLSTHNTSYQNAMLSRYLDILIIVVMLFACLLTLMMAPHKDAFLYNHLQPFLYPAIGMFLGSSLLFIRNHFSIKTEVNQMLTLFVFLAIIPISTGISYSLDLQSQKLSSIKQTAYFNYFNDSLSNKGTWEVLDINSSSHVPLQFKASYSTDNSQFDIMMMEIKNQNEAAYFLKEKLIDDYTFSHGHFNTRSMKYIYGDVPDDQTLYQAYPEYKHPDIDQGYDLTSDNYPAFIVQKDNYIYSIRMSVYDEKLTKQYLQIFEDFLTI